MCFFYIAFFVVVMVALNFEGRMVVFLASTPEMVEITELSQV